MQSMIMKLDFSCSFVIVVGVVIDVAVVVLVCLRQFICFTIHKTGCAVSLSFVTPRRIPQSSSRFPLQVEEWEGSVRWGGG